MSIDIDKLRSFYLVGSLQSFTKAAEHLDLSRSGVSRHINALESLIGVKLLDRDTTNVKLTPAGKLFLKKTEKILQEYESGLRELNEIEQGYTKKISFFVTSSLLATSFFNDISDYLDRNPKLSLDLSSTEKMVDLNLREADVAIQPFVDNRSTNIIYKPLIRYKTFLYGTEKYFSKHGKPKTIEDLKNHKLIGYKESFANSYRDLNWHLYLSDTPSVPFIVIDSGLGTVRAIQNGVAIGPLSIEGATYFEKNKEFIKLFPQHEGPPIELYYAYPAEHEHKEDLEEIFAFLHKRMNQKKVA